MRHSLLQVSQRAINRFLVVNCLREKRRLSRVELARELGLTPAAITRITSDLIQEGYIREGGPGNSNRGRKPILLELNTSAAYAIGIDLQHLDRLHAALVNLDCERLWRVERSIPETSLPTLVTQIQEAVEELTRIAGVAREAIFGVGVSFPGIVDYETGSVVLAANLNWENVPLRAHIQEALGMLTFLDNESNAAALGEYWYGQADVPSDFVYISVGTGIGSGLILGGRVYRGDQGTAGELGHMIVQPDGPMCRCGARGCLEAVAAEPAVLSWLVAEMEKEASSRISPPKRPREIYEAANANDPLACQAVRRMGRYLGIGVTNLINLLNPGTVIIGGSVWCVIDLLLEETRRTVAENAVTAQARGTRIIPSTLEADSALVGAAALVLEEVFQAPVFQPAGAN
jgi:glucokinase-like ROK family protein